MIGDYRLVVPAAGAWLAAAMSIGIPPGGDSSAVFGVAGLLGVAAVGSLVAAITTARFATDGRRAALRGILALGAVTLAVAALVVVAIAAKVPTRYAPELQAAAGSGRAVVATLASTERADGDGPWRADVMSVRMGTTTVAVQTRMLVFDGAPPAGAQIGTTMEVAGTLAPTEAGDDVAYLLFASTPGRVTEAPSGLIAWANDVRAGFATAAGTLPGAGAQLLPGLAIGDTRAVSIELDQAMKTSSLSHLTAVSGANCAIVIALMMLAGSAIGLPRALRITSSLAVLVAFVILVTPEPSVIRAATMATIVLIALLVGRPVSGISVVGLAVIVLLVGDPWLSRNYGFALSVLATTGLLVLARPLATRLSRVMPPGMALIVSVPLAAQLACQPVLILLSPSIPVYGLLANIVAAPAAPIATVIGLAACLLLPVAPWLGEIATWLAWVPAAWVASVAQFSAGLPFARLPCPGGVLGVALVAFLTIACLAAVLMRSRPLIRVLSAATAVVTVVALGVAIGATRLAETFDRPGDWQIAVCDVGQGDSVIVRSAGAIALIDTGREPSLVSACLNELGVTHINLLVLTHFDLDHVGGSSAVIGRVDRALVGPSSGIDDDLLVESVAAGGAIVDRVTKGVEGTLGDLRWSVLWPPAQLHGFEPGNDASVTIEFDSVGACPRGCLSSLFLADLGEESQAAMMRANTLHRVDVVKVAHHGSADQNPRLYERVQAAVGMIGVGADNGYGHPTQEILDTLASVGTTVTRTDAQGMALLAPGDEPGTVAVWTERHGDGRGG